MDQPKEIKKAVIPVAGLGTRFLPLSKAVPKEFLPLADRAVIEYIVEEMKNSGIKEIVFVVSPDQKDILSYFKKSAELERLLVKRKKDKVLKELKDFDETFHGISFSLAVQKKPLGDGNAILQAAKYVGKDSFAVSFGDDVVDSDEPAILQLMNIYKTCSAPVIALKQLPPEKIPSYGVVAVEKIANHLYKIKKIVEKPEISQAPSNLVVVGKYILTPEVMQYLKKAPASERGENILADAFEKMLSEGKVIYGYELKGEWLECGDKLKWMKSFFYMALKDPRFKDELRQYLKSLR